MKKLFLTALILLAPLSLMVRGQVSDTWHGKLQVAPNYSLPLVLHITEVGEGYEGTLDSPDQGAIGIPIDQLTFDADSLLLRFKSPSIGVAFQGTLDGDTIRGLFVQNGFFAPLNLLRGEYQVEMPEELPYQAIEVSIPSGNVVLAGTLTHRAEEGDIALLLVAGSGPNNRDSQIGPHKPLYNIADYLTQQGFAVMRYDKRGVGKSTGVFGASLLADFVTDARSALAYLRGLGYKRVGIVGHSEGGWIAQMVAAEAPKEVDFIVLLAAPGVSGMETIIYQNRVMMEYLLEPDRVGDFTRVIEEVFNEITYHSDSRTQDSLLIANYFAQVLPMVREEQRTQTAQMVQGEGYFRGMLNAISSPYYKEFLRSDPSRYLPHITCPILALNGSKDMQVEAKANLEAIKRLATASPRVTVVELEGLNHLFLKANTGLPMEYMLLEPGFSEESLQKISSWITSLPID